MTIDLELWWGDWETNKTDRKTKLTDQYTWKIFHFASNKQTDRQGWKHNLLLPSVAEVIIPDFASVGERRIYIYTYISRCKHLTSSPRLVAALWSLVLTAEVMSIVHCMLTGFIFVIVLNFMSFIIFRWCRSCKCGIQTTDGCICLRNFKISFHKGRSRCSFDKWRYCLCCNR